MSALALLKVAMHARSGGNLEVISCTSFELDIMDAKHLFVTRSFAWQDSDVITCHKMIPKVIGSNFGSLQWGR